MTKHILQDVDVESKPENNAFAIDPTKIKVVDGWNPRTDFSGEEELMASIFAKGVITPLKVKKNADKELELVDGERRLRATMRLISEGKEIKSVPVIVRSSKTSEIDAYLEAIIENTGKPLTPVEEATCFKRLKAWGLSAKEIADSCGRSESHVRNRLSLADATPAVKQAVNDKEITAGDAIEIVKESGGKVETEEFALLDKQTAPRKPRQKVTRIFINKGSISIKGEPCQPLATMLAGQQLRDSLTAAGFDPDSVKITISKQATEPDGDGHGSDNIQ